MAGDPSVVAQVANLLYRRLPVGMFCERRDLCGLEIRDTADWKSALPKLFIVISQTGVATRIWVLALPRWIPAAVLRWQEGRRSGPRRAATILQAWRTRALIERSFAVVEQPVLPVRVVAVSGKVSDP